MQVVWVYGCRLNSYQYFIVLGNGYFNLFKLKNIR